MTNLPDSGDAEHRVTTALVRLLVLGDGILWHNPLVDPVLRGALMIDWTVSGRLVENDADFELDTTPSGNPAADALLARIAARPERPLTEWLQRRQPTLSELVEPMVANGVLSRTHYRLASDGYRDPADYEMSALRRTLLDVLMSSQPDEPPMVALAVLAQLVGVLGTEASAADDYTVCLAGELSWLLMEVRDFGAERLHHMKFMSSFSWPGWGDG